MYILYVHTVYIPRQYLQSMLHSIKVQLHMLTGTIKFYACLHKYTYVYMHVCTYYVCTYYV